jgi:hypothetical protein
MSPPAEAWAFEAARSNNSNICHDLRRNNNNPEDHAARKTTPVIGQHRAGISQNQGLTTGNKVRSSAAMRAASQ